MMKISTLKKIGFGIGCEDIAPLIPSISVVQDERHAFRLGTLKINESTQAGVEF